MACLFSSLAMLFRLLFVSLFLIMIFLKTVKQLAKAQELSGTIGHFLPTIYMPILMTPEVVGLCVWGGGAEFKKLSVEENGFSSE